MKKSLLSLLILVVGNSSAVAAIQHKNCEITSNYNYSAPQMPGIIGDGDWATNGPVDRRFERLGYISTGAKDYREMKDGDLYTSAVLVYGGMDSSNYYAYVLIRIRQKDLSIKGPDLVLAEESSDRFAPYVENIDLAIDNAWAEAINKLPSCRIKSESAAK